MATLADKITSWVDAPGNSQRELGDKTGVADSTISRIRSDPGYEPGYYKALKLLAVVDPQPKGGDQLDRVERLLERIDRLLERNDDLEAECKRLRDGKPEDPQVGTGGK